MDKNIKLDVIETLSAKLKSVYYSVNQIHYIIHVYIINKLLIEYIL